MAPLIVDRPSPIRQPEAEAAPRPRMLRTADIAELLDLPAKRVSILAREGIIPRVKVGRSVRFNEADILAWVAAGGSAYPAEAQ